MKRLLAAAAALGALIVANPAQADPYRPYPGGYQDRDYRPDYRPDYRGSFTRDDLYRIERRIDWGYRYGALSRREAAYLSAQLNDLRYAARYYWQTNGISWRERQILDARYERLTNDLQRALMDDDRDGRRWEDRRWDNHGW